MQEDSETSLQGHGLVMFFNERERGALVFAEKFNDVWSSLHRGDSRPSGAIHEISWNQSP